MNKLLIGLMGIQSVLIVHGIENMVDGKYGYGVFQLGVNTFGMYLNIKSYLKN